MKNKLFVSWCSGTNFGDELNRYIWLKYLNKDEIVLAAPQNTQIIGCGSIFEELIGHSRKTKILPELKVVSTGMDFHRNIDYTKCYTFLRKLKIYALRGKKTAEMVSILTGKEIDLKEIVLADIGLLADDLLYEQRTHKTYELGIVPHYMEKDDFRFHKLSELIPGSTILDVDEDPIIFVNKMAKCKRIASSALHPLIAADSLHIPNIWIRASQEVTSIEKYEDYYSSFDIKKDYIIINILLNSCDILGLIDRNTQVPEKKINEKKRELVNMLEGKLKSDIEKEEKSLCWKCHSLFLYESEKYRHFVDRTCKRTGGG